MSAHANPDIIDDGLVFLYDTDDGKSYKGEPTTNLITNSGTSNTGWVGYGWTGSQAISNDYPNTYEFTATNGWHNRTFDTGVTSGGTIYVTFQYKLKQQQTTQNQLFVLNGTHLGSYTNWLGSGSMSFEWQTFSGSFTANANSSKIAIGPRGQDSSGLTDIVYIRNLQVEQKPHATPFVNGTRSATQGLLDRTGNTTIDLSNVSFDSNAQMTFDGTNDYAEVADQNSLDLVTAMSFEFVVKPDSSQSNPYPRLIDKSVYLLHLTSTSPFGVYQNIYTSGGLRQTGISSVVTAGNWNHIVCTYDGQYGKIYVDAELVKTRDFGSVLACNTNSSSLKIAGDGTTNRPLNGEMPISKIYNKVLTASEVLQNYNATKGRFS
jgi:hypothetical protein